MRRLLILMAIVCAAQGAIVTLRAHDLPIEPIVEMQIRAAGSALNVDVRMPIAGLADANLPRGENRRLAHPEVDDVLLIAGRELASSLAFFQADQPLAAPQISTTIAGDELAVTFHLQYGWRPDGGPLSARLHTVRATPGPRMRMTAQFFAANDTPRAFSVAGEPERVVFEPGPATVARHFIEHAIRKLLGGGDILLMLLCLAAPARPRRELRAATLALAAGHAAGLLWGAGSLEPPVAGAAAGVALAIAASCVVAGAVLNVAGDRSIATRIVAAALGLFAGLAAGDALREQTAFAGSHAVIAVGIFLAAFTLGLIWFVAIVRSALELLRQRGLPEVVGTIALSVYAAHTALHHFRAQTASLADNPSWLLSHLSVLVVSGWMTLTVVVAVTRAMRGATPPPEWRHS